MNKLTKHELQEYWQLAFNEEDFDTCLAIDDYYRETYGITSLNIWIEQRI